MTCAQPEARLATSPTSCRNHIESLRWSARRLPPHAVIDIVEARALSSIPNGSGGGAAPRRQRKRFGGTGGLALSSVIVTRRFGAM